MESFAYKILDRLNGLRITSRSPLRAEACCPSHDDSKPSLSISEGSEGKLLLQCHGASGCTQADILKAIGCTWGDLYPDRIRKDGQGEGHLDGAKRGGRGQKGTQAATTSPDSAHAPAAAPVTRTPRRGRVVANYDYFDLQGQLQFRVTRFDPKGFVQCVPVPGKPGRWDWTAAPAEKRILYRWPELHAETTLPTGDPERPVFVVEGEKDVERLRASSLTATTNPGGASKKEKDKKWLPQYTEALRGKHVVVIPDQDLPDPKTGEITGHLHAAVIANELAGVAASVRVLHLPVLPGLDTGKKWDVSDWLDARGTRQQFHDALAACQPWTKQDRPEPTTPAEADDDPYRLARLFANQGQHPDGMTVRFWKEQFWLWEANRYRGVELPELRARVAGFVKQLFDAANLQAQKSSRAALPPVTKRVTCGLISNMTLALSAISVLPAHIQQPSWIGNPPDGGSQNSKNYVDFANGILNVDKWLESGDATLLPHTPLLFSQATLDYEFQPGAQCPAWLKFVDRVFAGDAERIAILQEWFGYCLTFDTSYQRFLIAHGEGANGKSVACAALTALLGPENVSNLSLDQFAGEFGLMETHGKLLNIAAEISDMERVHEGVIKMLVSGDRVTVNRKNRSHMTMLPTARLMFATNLMPKFADRSNGIWRRMILLPFDQTIGAHERIHGMDKPEWWRGQRELPGMLLWALEGLKRLRQQGEFSFSALSTLQTEDFRDESNPARAFLKEFYEPCNTGEVIGADLYRGYRKWCEDNNHRPLASNMFGREVKRVFPYTQPCRITADYSIDGGVLPRRVNGYRGIVRRPEAESLTATPIW